MQQSTVLQLNRWRGLNNLHNSDSPVAHMLYQRCLELYQDMASTELLLDKVFVDGSFGFLRVGS